MIGARSCEPERARRCLAATIAAATPAVSRAASASQAAKPRCPPVPFVPPAVARDCEAGPRSFRGVVRRPPKASAARSARSRVGLVRVEVAVGMTAAPGVRILPSTRRRERRIRVERTAGNAATPEDGTAERPRTSCRETAVPAVAGRAKLDGDPVATGVSVATCGLAVGAVVAGAGTVAGGDVAGGGAGGAGLDAATGSGWSGRNSSGSTYPFGSSERRTPRWTYGMSCSTSPLGPIVPTTSPSETVAPRWTLIEPRWVSVTE